MGTCCAAQMSWEIPRGRKFKKLIDEEKCLIEREREFGLSNLDARIVFLIFSRQQNQESLSKAQVSDIGDQLSLSWIKYAGEQQQEEVAAAQAKFLANFALGDGYHSQKLIILGLLFSSGSPTQKAMHYVRLLDPMAEGSISKENFTTVYAQAEAISTDFLKEYNTNRCNENQKLIKDRVTSMIYDLHKTKEKAKNQAVEKFFGDKTELSKDDFVKKFIENQILTSTYTMRVFAAEVLKNTPVTETLPNTLNAFANLLKRPAAAKIEEKKTEPSEPIEMEST